LGDLMQACDDRNTEGWSSTPQAIDTHLTQFSARKIIFSPLARGAHEAVCAPQKWLIVLVIADPAARRPAELRTNSDSAPSTPNLTTG
jgi:hypothetical protein